MTSSTAPTTSSSPHFCFQCSTNCFHYPGIILCCHPSSASRYCCLCQRLHCRLCCHLHCCRLHRRPSSASQSHHLRCSVVVCVLALLLRRCPSSASWRCCLHRGIAASVTALLSASRHCRLVWCTPMWVKMLPHITPP
jgi:hypothetical protein